MKKRIIGIFMVLCMMSGLMSFMTFPALAATSGTCGDNLTWVLEEGTLTISGEGSMKNYHPLSYPSDPAPWYQSSITTSITNVVIESGVTSIGNYVFIDCSYLKSISISDSVTSIGSHAFDGCTSLTSITIPDSVTSIGSSAFYNCKSLLSVTIGSSVTSIGDSAFSGCNGLASITIPNSVKSIGTTAFSGCKGLSRLNIGSGMTSIGSGAFSNCVNLTRVNIPSIEVWCNIAFGSGDANPLYYVKNLHLNGELVTDITIPDSITSINGYAFYNYKNLTSISIPDSVKSIGNYAFYNCTSLTSVTIPNSVTSIGNSAFYNCTSLASVTIPNSVTSIAYSAFSYCSSLTSVTIPNSVTSIRESAFNGCTSLATVNYNGNETAWNSISISSNNSKLTNAERNYFGYVTYIDENGNVMQRDMVTIDTTVTLPDFSDIDETYGFYTDSAFTEEFDATEPIIGNTVIYVPLSLPPASPAPPEPFTINSIAIKDLSGNELSEIPDGKFLATVSITNTSSYSDAMVVLAQFSALGKFNGLLYVNVEDMPEGATFKLSIPIDNTAGDVDELKALVWDSFESMRALGNSVSFPAE